MCRVSMWHVRTSNYWIFLSKSTLFEMFDVRCFHNILHSYNSSSNIVIQQHTCRRKFVALVEMNPKISDTVIFRFKDAYSKFHRL